MSGKVSLAIAGRLRNEQSAHDVTQEPSCELSPLDNGLNSYT